MPQSPQILFKKLHFSQGGGSQSRELFLGFWLLKKKKKKQLSGLGKQFLLIQIISFLLKWNLLICETKAFLKIAVTNKHTDGAFVWRSLWSTVSVGSH